MRRRFVAALLAGAVVGFPTPAHADGVDDLPPVSDGDLRDSIGDVSLEVDDISLEVEDVEATTTEGAETVVTLKSDVLFGFGKATLPGSAQDKIAELVRELPKGARLKVHGHTDSIGGTSANRKLSQERAEAVAAGVRKARPDLRLDVRGFGESRPVEANTKGGKDNPEGRALNRRVELRYSS
jgi:outer membrane protein OmpA-like peptidoglycan-associated protein